VRCGTSERKIEAEKSGWKRGQPDSTKWSGTPTVESEIRTHHFCGQKITKRAGKNERNHLLGGIFGA